MLVVAAVIQREGRFLIARRASHKADAGYWEFPGGKVEPGETPPEALARELREEMDVVAEIGELLHQGSERGIDFEAYWVKIQGEPSQQDHDQFEWITCEGAAGKKMHDFDREVAARFQAGPTRK